MFCFFFFFFYLLVIPEQLSIFLNHTCTTASHYTQNSHTMYGIADYALQMIVLCVSYSVHKKTGNKYFTCFVLF
uniref:Putative ybaj n=1 Tax=Rhipicephalus microplus TaxID=6941 RepID=A0A6M2DBF6_RHIMP